MSLERIVKVTPTRLLVLGGRRRASNRHLSTSRVLSRPSMSFTRVLTLFAFLHLRFLSSRHRVAIKIHFSHSALGLRLRKQGFRPKHGQKSSKGLLLTKTRRGISKFGLRGFSMPTIDNFRRTILSVFSQSGILCRVGLFQSFSLLYYPPFSFYKTTLSRVYVPPF